MLLVRKNAVTDTLLQTSVDYYLMDELLTPDEREYRDRTRQFFDTEVIPIINPYWERAEFPKQLVPKLAALGLTGGMLKGYGCPGMSGVAMGMVAMEMSRGDGSIGTF